MNPWLNITCIMVVLYHFGVGTVSGTALTVGERMYVCSAIKNLYMDLIGKLGLDTSEVDGLLGWLISYEKIKNAVYELDEYVQWARNGAIMLLNSANNLSHQREEFDDLFQKTKDNILMKMLERGKPDAAASINKVLDNLKTALNKNCTIQEVETASKYQVFGISF